MQSIYPNSNSNARGVAGAKDARSGHGYGKSQRTSSNGSTHGTGIGSTRSMGSSETGIYTEPPAYIDYECSGIEDCECDACTQVDDKDIDAFNVGVRRNIDYIPVLPLPRGDNSSLAHSSQFNNVGLAESILIGEYSMPKTMKGIAPFTHSTLYPRGFDGAALGSGGSGQAFRTTGNYRKTGTLKGTAAAPQNSTKPEEFTFNTLDDIINFTNDERSLANQHLKILAILNNTDSIDDDEDDNIDNIDNLDDFTDEVLQ